MTTKGHYLFTCDNNNVASTWVRAITINIMFLAASKPSRYVLLMDSAEDRRLLRNLLGFPEGDDGHGKGLEKGRTEADRKWTYIDDYDQEQGPFTQEQLRVWVGAGYFREHTLVRPVPLTQEEADRLAYPHFLPISTLFPDARLVFANGELWKTHYHEAMLYQVSLAAVHSPAGQSPCDVRVVLVARLTRDAGGVTECC